MSFWEDRFVNRPHASPVPEHLESDVYGPAAADTSEPVIGRAWSIVSESAAEVAHAEPAEIEPEDSEAVKYRRRGLLRRRRPEPIASDVSDEAEEATASESEDRGAYVNGNGRPWAIVESQYEVEPTDDVALDENDTEPAGEDEPEDELASVEYRRRGLFRRRRPDPVAHVVDEQTEEMDVPELELGETQFNGHSSEVVEPADEIAADPAVLEDAESETVEGGRRGLFRRRRPEPVAPAVDDQSWDAEVRESAFDETNFNGNGHSWATVEAADEVAAEPIAYEETESETVDEARRGFFRRRMPAPVTPTAKDQWEDADVPEPELEESDFKANGRSWAVVEIAPEPVAAAEVEEAEIRPADDEPEEELAASVEVAKEKRGFFRRRKPEPVEDGREDEAEVHVVEPYEEPEIELQPAEDEPDAAALLEIANTVPGQRRRRGIFRRHRPEPEADLGDTELDGTYIDAADETISVAVESIEDDAFENIPFYTAEFPHSEEDEDTPDEYSPGEESPADSEHADGADVFVMSETDESEETPVEKPSEEPTEEPTEDLTSEPSSAPEDHSRSEDPDPEPEPAFEEAPEPAVAPAFEPEPFEEAGPEAPVHAAETEPELELQVEPEVEPELEVADEAPAFEHEPVVIAKRNGSGSARGKKVVGLKVGASQIAAAVVAGTGDRPALVDLARRSLEPGVVVDGELRDPEALAHALKTFFKDHGLPAKNVRLGLSSSRVGVRTFDIAGIEDEARFDNAVRFKAHEVLPVAAHESVLDYRVVEERYMENGEMSRRVLLVVAPRDQVAPYIEACQTAGLRLAGVDLEAFGLLRAFVPPLGARSRSEDSATVVAAIGHEASTLLVAGGGVCEFTRVFDWGGGALQAAIADELDVPLMEAATILTHLSLSGPGRHLDSLDSDTRSRALEAVRTRLMPFARELVSSLQFYQTQAESLGIREILITGGTSHLEGLADALHQMIGVNVSVGDPLGRVDVQTELPAALDATIGSMAVPIGLAIEDDAARSVNLLPKDARQGRKRPSLLAVAAPLAAVVPLAALAFAFVQANGATGDRQAELDVVRAQIEALPEPTRPNIDPALAGEQAQRATAVAQILGGRLSWERVLGDISRVLPQGVSLTELAATAPQPTTPEVAAPTTEDTSSTAPSTPTAPPPAAAPSTPTGVTVTGYALDYATIARALARVQAVPSLANAQLQSATPALIGKKRVIEFTIVADLAIPGGAQ